MKKILNYGFLFILTLMCLVLVSCDNTKAEDVIKSLMIEQQEGYVAEDFFVIGEIKSGDEAYPVTWTSDNACLTVSSEKNAAGYYTVFVNRPEDGMQEVKLTATLTVDKNNTASKTYSFKVYAYDVFDLLDNFVFEYKGLKVEMGTSIDLPTTTTYEGKTATISWASTDEEVDINEEGNKATFATVVKETPVTLAATLTYKDQSTTIKYELTVAPYRTNFELLKEWYENTGVTQKLSGYVVDIAANYDDAYGNVSLYIINDDFTGGYYLYRVKTDAENGAKIKVGAHVTVVGTTNTNYSGLMETNAGGNLVVDEDIEPINVGEKIYEASNDLIANAPSLYYRLSTQVSFSNWKVKEVESVIEAEGCTDSAVTIMKVEKDGVTLTLRYSNYLAATPMPNRNGGVKSDNYKAIEAKLGTIAVGDYVNVSGILSYYNKNGEQYNQQAYQILVQNADSIVKIDNGSDETNTNGKKVGAAIASFEGFAAAYVVDTELVLPTTLGDATVSWAFHNKYHNGAELSENTLVITPAGYSVVSLDATFTVGDYSTKVYYSFIVEQLSDEEIVDRTLEETTIEDIYAPGDITLPTTHEIYEGVEISYALKETYTSATLAGNKLTISNATLTADEKVTLVVTVKKGDKTNSKEIVFTVHKLEVTSVADFLEAKEKDVPSLLHGYITAVNKVGSAGSFVLTDLNGDSIFCYTSVEVELGSEVKLLAVYAVNNDHPQLGNPEVIEVISTENDAASKSGEVVSVTAAQIKENVTAKTRPEVISIYAGKYLEITGYVVANGSNYGVAATADASYVVNIYANSDLKSEIAKYLGQEVKLYGFSRGVYVGETGSLTIQAQSVAEIPLTDPQAVADFEANSVAFESTYKAGEVVLPTAKKFTDVVLSYVVKSGAENASIVDGKLVLVADGAVNKEVVITVTATMGEKTSSKDYTITVLADVEYITSMVTTPEANKEYYLRFDQTKKGQELYFKGTMSGFYGATTEVIADAVKVVLVAVEGGYNLKFVDSTGATKYINGVASGTYKNFKIEDTASSVWAWNAEYNTLTTTVGETVYMGSYGDNVTFGLSVMSYAASSYVSHLYEMKAVTRDEKQVSENATYLEGLFSDETITEAKAIVVELPHAATLNVTVAEGAKSLVWDAANNKLTITPTDNELVEKVTFEITIGSATKTVEVEIKSATVITPATHEEYYAATTGTSLYLQGVITSKKTDNKSYWIIDKTGATFQVYLSAANAALNVGDEVLFKGSIAEFRANRQLGSAAAVETVSTGNTVTSTDITADVTANGLTVTTTNHAQLVTIEGVVKSISSRNIVLTVGEHDVDVYNNGNFTLPTYFVVGAKVKVTGTLGFNNSTTAYQLNINVVGDVAEGAMNDGEKVAADLAALTITTSITDSIELPAAGMFGSTISWAVTEGTAIAIADGVATVTQPAIGEDPATVKLTATVVSGDASATKEFTITVAALVDPNAGPVETQTFTASKTVANLITEYGWTSSTTKQSFNLDDNVSVKINGGNNTGKAYSGDHIRIYATDSPAGTITITVPEGYELVSIKITTQTGTYAFLYVDGTTTDISNKSVDVSGNSVLLNSVKNGSDGKQVRVTAFEVVYKAVN